MSEANKDGRKRPSPNSSSGESATSTPKPESKKAKAYDPAAETLQSKYICFCFFLLLFFFYVGAEFSWRAVPGCGRWGGL